MRRLLLTARSVLVPLLAVMLVLAAVSAPQAQCGGAFAAAGSGPVGGVPAALIPLFQGASGRYHLGPHGASILAAINYVESTFGQSNLPGVHSGANYAGAEGPMQFLASTWQTEGVNAPADPVGQPPNVYDEADAVYGGAHYLHDLGMTASPSSWPGAIFGYNHSLAYVQQVLARASSYYTQGLATQSAGGTSVPVALTGRIKVPAASGDPVGRAGEQRGVGDAAAGLNQLGRRDVGVVHQHRPVRHPGQERGVGQVPGLVAVRGHQHRGIVRLE